MRKLLAVAVVVSVISLSGCGWFQTRKSENPVPEAQLSPQASLWSIEDNRTVAAQFIGEALGADWLSAFVQQYQRKPVVLVRSVVNMTEEPLPVDGFVRDLSRELLKSGKVRLVSLREDQLDDGTMDVAGDSGAEFAFKALIELTGNQDKDARSKLYRAQIVLIDLQKDDAVWKTETQIQKQNSRN